jgi:pimeloyl-ACP methyl ester carboxylesterase
MSQIDLAYADAGAGDPVILLHEFAGSMSAWGEQVEEFADKHRVITYNARGYPPSAVPTRPGDYSQDLAVQDLHDLMNRLSIDRAALVGLSMGGSTALMFALCHPERVRCLVLAATGSGSDDKQAFINSFGAEADFLEREGSARFADRYLRGPTRLQLLYKRPAAWTELRDQLGAVPSMSLARTIRGVMLARPSVYDLEAQLRSLTLPTLILIGDEDSPVLRPAGFLHACLSSSQLVVFRKTGHTLNLEEPAEFNDAVRNFLRIGRE